MVQARTNERQAAVIIGFSRSLRRDLSVPCGTVQLTSLPLGVWRRKPSARYHRSSLKFIFEVAELKRGSLMRRLAKAVLVTGGVDLRTVT